ncbi:hypothetical protein BELL_0266g00120 [Botrytis elliptica]|uniref:Uncharacterized protein n=1 Tax=Botrytis elliptica TaxID=278938 RepID=A0A4Z1JLM1_9HELO|nr:hypothetical protein BELL_0266g00120 [Botrytis elliptica]
MMVAEGLQRKTATLAASSGVAALLAVPFNEPNFVLTWGSSSMRGKARSHEFRALRYPALSSAIKDISRYTQEAQYENSPATLVIPITACFDAT